MANEQTQTQTQPDPFPKTRQIFDNIRERFGETIPFNDFVAQMADTNNQRTVFDDLTSFGDMGIDFEEFSGAVSGEISGAIGRDIPSAPPTPTEPLESQYTDFGAGIEEYTRGFKESRMYNLAYWSMFGGHPLKKDKVLYDELEEDLLNMELLDYEDPTGIQSAPYVKKTGLQVARMLPDMIKGIVESQG